MKESKLYIILRPLIKIFTKLFLKPTYIGLDNIPKEGKIILAGNHTDIYDSILLISSTKRPIHFLAKKELWKFPSKIIMAHMGLIPVDRQNKSPNSLLMAKKYLNDDKLVLIFPEGTTEKEYGKLLPFKMGVIKLAYDTNTKIVPFAITGKYFKKDLRIKFGNPINVSKDLEKDLDKLKNNISNLRK